MKLIDLITISDDGYEEDQNHTSSPSSEGPQDPIPNPISPTSSTTTNISTIYTRTARGISCSSSGRQSVSSRKLIEIRIPISDTDDDEVDSSNTVECSQGSQKPYHISRSHQIPSSLTKTNRKKLKSNLDTKILYGSGTAEKEGSQLLNLTDVATQTHETLPSASDQPTKIQKSEAKASLQCKINQKNNAIMFPGLSVPINSALNKVKLETDYIPVKSETTVNNSDQPPLPLSVSPPLPPPLPEVISLESPPCGEFPLLPPPPQWADDPLSTSPPLLVETDPISNSRMGSRVQAQEIAEPLQSASSSSRNGKTSKTFRVKDAAKVKSRKEKGRRTHTMRLRFRETTQEKSALQQQQPQISVSDNSAVSITNSNRRKRIGIGGTDPKGQGRPRTSQQRQRQRQPRFVWDKNLTCVTPVNGIHYYVCKFCKKTFINHSHGAEHVRIHTGDKPFKCSHCGRGFANKFNSTEHEFIHTGQKDLKCKFCSRMFRHRSSRSKHHRTCAKKN